MKVRYIIQARISSTRLAGKILMEIGHKPLLQHIIDRILLSGAERSQICFALANENSKELQEFFIRQNIPWMTGETENVLARYVLASENMVENDIIVRFTADNPFIDYVCLRDVVKTALGKIKFDLAYPYKLPLGMGFEMFTKGALLRQMEYDLQPHHKEHVTTFIKENRNIFQVEQLNYFENSPDIRLTIDYQEDLDQARKIYDYFQNLDKENFCSGDVFQLYQADPDFFSINRMMKQKKF